MSLKAIRYHGGMIPLSAHIAAPSSPPRLPARALVTFAAVCALVLSPATASAERRPSDAVGDRTLRAVPALSANAPDIDAPAGLLVTSDGRVLWSRDAGKRRAMASTTKMMTALVVLERAKLSDVVIVPKAAAGVAQNAVNLIPGERLTVRQLLETMLVSSANDAAYTLAVHVGGSEARFATLMNEKAAKLGLKDTHYVNSHGLDKPGHHSTAADLVTLGRVAMRDAEFRRIVGLRSVVITGPGTRRRVFETTDEMLSAYSGMEGIKTGMTNDAGYCLVSAARRGQVELYGVILGTRSEGARFTQSRRLLDWGFAHYRPIPVVAAGSVVGTIPVGDWLDRDIVAKVAEGRSSVMFDLGGAVRRRYELRASVSAPVRAGQVVGVVSAFQGSTLLATAPVVSSSAVDAPGFWEGARIWAVRSWRSVFGPRVMRTATVTAKD